MRRLLVVGCVVLAVALVFGGAVSLLAPPTAGPGGEATAEPDVYRLEGHESGVWPFLSPEPAPVERSPINVVVRGDAERVGAALEADGDREWEGTPPDERHAEPDAFVPEDVDPAATGIEWTTTTGTARYAYVHDGESGEWVRETAQLHDGTYYGHRTHIRLYESPHDEEDWVAMQVHTEHFDWFTLRHTVDGVEEGQRRVEADFMGSPAVDRVSREYLGNDGPSDADGWASVIELAAVAFAIGTVSLSGTDGSRLAPADRRRIRAARERLTARHGLLVAATGGLLLGVRGAGILLEVYVPLSVHAIAALLYPFVGVGIPLTAYGLGGTFERRVDAGVSAAVGLGLAVLLDYAVVGVAVLPIDVVLHRIGVVLAVGLVAAGAAGRSSRGARLDELALAGLLAWVVLSLATLFQVI